MDVKHIADLHAIIPAGGTGKRLWPLARVQTPKFLRDLTGSGRSLLQDTVARARMVCPPDRISIVTARNLADQVRSQTPELPDSAIITEPYPRHSMAAVALATAVIVRHEPEAIIAVFPADHVIRDMEAFSATIQVAAEVARAGEVVSIGVETLAPATSFGYIATGEPADVAATGADLAGAEVRRVAGFVEKPGPEEAAKYVLAGTYLWNTGIVLAKASVLLAHLSRLRPEVATAVDTVADNWWSADRERVLDGAWGAIKRESIDKALAIPLANEGIGLAVRGNFRWDDVRDLRSLSDSLARRLDGLKVLGADSAVAVDTRGGLVVSTTGRQVVILGLDDAVVIDTPDAILVTTGSRCKEVPLAVEKLRAAGRENLL